MVNPKRGAAVSCRRTPRRRVEAGPEVGAEGPPQSRHSTEAVDRGIDTAGESGAEPTVHDAEARR